MLARLPVLGLLLLPILPASVRAQVQAARDGGTREVLVSIFVPPVTEAPFSLTLATEWTRPLGGGGTYTVANSRRIQRDSKGRIYQERWLLVPKGDKVESVMTSTEITDPATHTRFNSITFQKKCYQVLYPQTARSSFQAAPAPTGPLANGDGFKTTEELGSSTFEGVDTAGSRETTTINAGVYGNDQPMVTTREFWFAPKLGINMLSRLDSPQSGRQVSTVKEISLSEPETQMFALPEGYVVIVDEQEKRPVTP